MTHPAAAELRRLLAYAELVNPRRGKVATSSVLTPRGAVRLAMEFDTPEALKKYLSEHPRADKANHTVKKPERAEGGKKEKSKVPKSKPMENPEKAARVGIPGEVVAPPPKLPKLRNLTKEEAEIESLMNEGIEKDPEGAAKAFLDIAKDNNWVFETDGAKALLPQWTRPDLQPDEKGQPIHPERANFRGKFNAIIHQGANAIAKRAFLSRLDDIAKMPEDRRKVLVTSGGVACHGKGTPILMFDGSLKTVETVALGDLVMGPDSKPRTVQAVTRGLGPMYLVRPKRGDPFTANDKHVLSLKYALGHQHSVVKVVNLTIEEVLNRGKRFKRGSLLYRTGVAFPNRQVPLDPYFLGVWLGDGTSSAPHITSADSEIEDFLRDFAARFPSIQLRKSPKPNNKASTYRLTLSGKPIGKGPDRNPITMALEQIGVMRNKHIPDAYLINNEQVRLQVLAGLLDTDGHYNPGNKGFSFVTKFRRLADNVAFLSRSLGFGASVKEIHKQSQTGYTGKYYQLWIGGNDLERIPTRIGRKRAKNRPGVRSNGRTCRDALHTGYTLEYLGVDFFYGFTLDQDGLYLLGDFTVTHNSGKGSALAAQPDLAKSVAATWDAAGEQNATENEWLLKECQKRGIKPIFLFVHADPKQAWPGVIERAKSIGRMVDAQLFTDSYVQGGRNFAKFYEDHKDDANFVFGRFKGRGEPAEILDEMPPEVKELDPEEVYEHVSEYTDTHKEYLPKFVYEGATIGRRVWTET